jgi:DNA-binding LacI/PurR family transcriptional regulator
MNISFTSDASASSLLAVRLVGGKLSLVVTKATETLTLHVTKESTMASAPKSSRERVQRYRDRMRAQGLRPTTFWVPDTKSEEFRRHAHADSVAIAQSDQEADDQAFIDSVSVWTTDEFWNNS